MLAVAIMAGVYSGKLDHFNYVSQAKAAAGGDAWIDALERQVRERGPRAACSLL